MLRHRRPKIDGWAMPCSAADMAFRIFKLGPRGFRFQSRAVAFLSFVSRRGFPE